MKRWDAILRRIPEKGFFYMVEIGVLRGLISRNVLEARKNVFLFMIDPWEASKPGDRYYDSGDKNATKSQAEHDKDMRTARDIAKIYGGNKAEIIRKRSLDAVKEITPGTIDFVFIDGDHSEEGVSEDIAAWRGMIRKGGWIGGHDYDHPEFPGVKKAVDEAFPSGIELDSERTWFYRMGGGI
jgi:Methyltransferase domain